MSATAETKRGPPIEVWHSGDDVDDGICTGCYRVPHLDDYQCPDCHGQVCDKCWTLCVGYGTHGCLKFVYRCCASMNAWSHSYCGLCFEKVKRPCTTCGRIGAMNMGAKCDTCYVPLTPEPPLTTLMAQVRAIDPRKRLRYEAKLDTKAEEKRKQAREEEVIVID